MENYEKPSVIINDELSEGVYAGSGCYTVTIQKHQSPQTGRGDYRFQVYGVHNADHATEKQELVICFNKPVVYKSSDGDFNYNNGHILSIVYYYYNNPNDKIGIGDIVVEADSGLEVCSAVINCK